jgi:hypothetical protein
MKIGRDLKVDIENLMFYCEIREPAFPIITPWKIIKMNPDFSGQWLVVGDLDNDGELEFVSARNDNQSVTAISAYKLDGTLIWRWGEAGKGKSKLSYDVPLQIYDINGDGKNEVILSEPGFLVILDGLNGRQLRRYPLPKELEIADCIVFANLQGKERASDIIIKTRYTKLWAYSYEWDELWSWTPKGYMTCHHPTPVDLDGDGKDEVMAGYTMLDHDGNELWTFKSKKVDLSRGHLDCCRVAEKGNKPDEFRFAVTCCGANLIALLDGLGNIVWEIDGHHFESLRVGPMTPGLPDKQIFVDIDHTPYGNSQTWLIDFEGHHFGTYLTNYSRHHGILDWNGDGFYEVVLANALSICDGSGNRVALFALDQEPKEVTKDQPGSDPNPLVNICDVNGDGADDVVLHTDTKIFVYLNPSKAGKDSVITDIGNFTLY